ncbi:MAG: LysE family translocator [Chitinophagaceae bacterium]
MIENFWVFALTGFLLNITPGNDMLYVIARSSGQGTKAGIISALGIGAGCVVHIVAAVIGLSALIAQSAIAFTIIKYVGACYLVYLGVMAILTSKRSLQIETTTRTISGKKIFLQAVITNVLNPKVALFFLAFLPQFISLEKGNTTLQIFYLGVWFNTVGTLVNILIAILFGRIGRLLFKSPLFISWQQRITGAILIGLGIKLTFSAK